MFFLNLRGFHRNYMAKILLIEDEPLVLKVLEFKLSKDGHEIHVSSDGREAVEKLRTEEFDLIVSDLMLPFVSGLEIVNLLKREIKKTTPIILLTANGLEKTVVEAFELGADDFMTKPFSPAELSIRVNKLLKKS